LTALQHELPTSVWGITAPFWFAFAGSALILALIWRSLLDIAHTDEHARAGSPLPRPDRRQPHPLVKPERHTVWRNSWPGSFGSSGSSMKPSTLDHQTDCA
jgi:hypothetical protein